MSMTVNTQFSPLTFTKNNLVNAINFLNDKNVVVLHSTEAFRIFHAIIPNTSEKSCLFNTRVIYIDCNSDKKLLDKDCWDFFFESVFKNRLYEVSSKNKLGKLICNQAKVPNKEYISLIGK